MVQPSEIIAMNMTMTIRMLVALFTAGDRKVTGGELTLADVTLNEKSTFGSKSVGENRAAVSSMTGAATGGFWAESGNKRESIK